MKHEYVPGTSTRWVRSGTSGYVPNILKKKIEYGWVWLGYGFGYGIYQNGVVLSFFFSCF